MMGIFLVLYVLEKHEGNNKVRDATDFSLSKKKKNEILGVRCVKQRGPSLLKLLH